MSDCLSEQELTALEPQREVLDKRVLRQLRELGGPSGTALLERLVPVFLGDVPKRLAALGEAIDAGVMAEVARVAHYLKGSAANLGATQMSNLCAELEMVSDLADLKACSALLENLHRELCVVRTALEDEFSH